MQGIVRFLVVMVLAASLVAPVGCAQNTNSQSGSSSTVSAEKGGATTELKKNATVIISNFAFSPGTVTIAKGGTVTWTNKDSTPHTVTANDNSFDSGQLSIGKTYKKTFDKTGSYPYYCSIHPTMTATVVVK